jgi:hypothetical protein
MSLTSVNSLVTQFAANADPFQNVITSAEMAQIIAEADSDGMDPIELRRINELHMSEVFLSDDSPVAVAGGFGMPVDAFADRQGPVTTHQAASLVHQWLMGHGMRPH